MVNGLHLYSAFIQSALQFMPLIHPFTHTFTHQWRLTAMQGTNQFNQCTINSERFLRTAKQIGVQVGELRMNQETGGQPRTSPGTREAGTGRNREQSQPGVGQGPWDWRTV